MSGSSDFGRSVHSEDEYPRASFGPASLPRQRTTAEYAIFASRGGQTPRVVTSMLGVAVRSIAVADISMIEVLRVRRDEKTSARCRDE